MTQPATNNKENTVPPAPVSNSNVSELQGKLGANLFHFGAPPPKKKTPAQVPAVEVQESVASTALPVIEDTQSQSTPPPAPLTDGGSSKKTNKLDHLTKERPQFRGRRPPTVLLKSPIVIADVGAAPSADSAKEEVNASSDEPANQDTAVSSSQEAIKENEEKEEVNPTPTEEQSGDVQESGEKEEPVTAAQETQWDVVQESVESAEGAASNEAKALVDNWAIGIDIDYISSTLRSLTNAQRWDILQECTAHTAEEYVNNPRLAAIVFAALAALTNDSEISGISLENAKTEANLYKIVKLSLVRNSPETLFEIYVDPETAANRLSNLIELSAGSESRPLEKMLKVFLDQCIDSFAQ